MGNGKSASPPSGPQDKSEIEAVLERIGRRVRELRAFDASSIRDRWDGRLEQLQKGVNQTIADAVGMGSAQYRQLAIGPLDSAIDSTFGDRITLDEMRAEVRRAAGQAVMRLNAAAKVLERRLAGATDSTLAPLGDVSASNFAPLSSSFAPLAPEPPPAPRPAAAPMFLPEPASEPAAEPEAEAPVAPASSAADAAPATPEATADEPVTVPIPLAPASPMDTSASSSRSPRIAIVCRDDSAGEAVTTFVADLGLEPVISQEPGTSASSLEVLEALRQTDFALVLQADRQLEIGFLLGVLGRGRLRVLQSGDSDEKLPGVQNQPLDEGGLWKLLLARELKKSGIDVDLNKAL